jgi:hypothetical protein
MAVARASTQNLNSTTRDFASGGKPVISGGTITFAGDFTVHRFGSGTTTMTVTLPGRVEYLVVAGGGGGGGGAFTNPATYGGGGGAGGYLTGFGGCWRWRWWRCEWQQYDVFRAYCCWWW